MVLDGSLTKGSCELAGLGNSGLYPGNLARDFRRRILRNCRETLPIYSLDAPFLDPVKNGIVFTEQCMILPHEYLAYLHHWPEQFQLRMFGEKGTDLCSKFWMRAPLSPWYADHPAREHIEANPTAVIPARIYGDDAAYQNRRSALVLTWSSVISRLPSMQSRFVISVVPLLNAVDATRHALYKVVAWSFQQMLLGVFPVADPCGRPWPEGSWRAKVGGTPLAGGIAVALVQVLIPSTTFQIFLQRSFPLPPLPVKDFNFMLLSALSSLALGSAALFPAPAIFRNFWA